MANNIEIIIKSIDQSTAVLKKVEKNTKDLSKSTKKLADNNKALGNSFNVVKTAIIGLSTIIVGNFFKSLIDVGKQIEGLQVRLKLLFGSAQQGAKAFDIMADFAGRVPFSLEQIQLGAGNLAVVADDAEHLGRILEITGNVASATGIDFRTASEQIQRSFSGGIASADIFRERGVRSMLGFEQGSKVSIEQTVDAFQRVFAGDGEFSKATEEFAKTFEGTLSMVGDKIFNFKRLINQAFFDELKKQFNALDTFLADAHEPIEDIAKTIGESLATAVKVFADFVRFAHDNSTILINTLKVFIGLKLGTLFLRVATSIKAMSLAMIAFNKVTKSNVFFKLVGLLIIFNDKIREAATALQEFFEENQTMPDLKLELKADEVASESDKITKKLQENQAKVRRAFGEGFREHIETNMGGVVDVLKSGGDAVASTFLNAVDSVGVAFADMVMAGDFSAKAFKNIFKDMAKEVIRQVAIMIARLIALKAMSVALGVPLGTGTGGAQAGIISSFIPAVKKIPVVGKFLAKGGIVEGGLQGLPSYANGGITTEPQLAVIGDNANNREAVVPLPDGRSIPVDLQGGGNQTIGTINIMPNAQIDQALMDKPMSYWRDFTERKILPALNVLGKSGSTTTLNFRKAR